MSNDLDKADLGKNPLGLDSSGKPYRVFIVDDSLFVAKQISQILTSEGFIVIDTAQDGEEAIEKYKEKYDSIDVVTLDITMPKMDGVTALEQILSFDPTAKVVMISALGRQDLVKKSLILGAKGYIVKPLDRKKVLDRVVAVLK